MKTRLRDPRAEERAAISATRRRYYDALASGLKHDEATAAANRDRVVTLPYPQPNFTPRPFHPKPPAEPREQQRAVEIPGDWESLPYVPREAGAMSLRALASQVSSTPIRNKVDAENAVRAELELRAKESAAANAAVEIPDDWDAMALEDAIALASRFTAETVATAGDVERVIQTELARRAG